MNTRSNRKKLSKNIERLDYLNALKLGKAIAIANIIKEKHPDIYLDACIETHSRNPFLYEKPKQTIVEEFCQQD